MTELSTWITHLVTLLVGAGSVWVALRRSGTEKRTAVTSERTAEEESERSWQKVQDESARRWSSLGLEFSAQVRQDNEALRADILALRLELRETTERYNYDIAELRAELDTLRTQLE